MDSVTGSARRHWIAPFGNPRIRGHLRLPVDYRGLSRPSSLAVAKASVMRPNSLPARSLMPHGAAVVSLGGHALRTSAACQPVSLPAGLASRFVVADPDSRLNPPFLLVNGSTSMLHGLSKSVSRVSPGGKQRNMRRVGLACAPGGAGLIP